MRCAGSLPRRLAVAVDVEFLKSGGFIVARSIAFVPFFLPYPHGAPHTPVSPVPVQTPGRLAGLGRDSNDRDLKREDEDDSSTSALSASVVTLDPETVLRFADVLPCGHATKPHIRRLRFGGLRHPRSNNNSTGAVGGAEADNNSNSSNKNGHVANAAEAVPWEWSNPEQARAASRLDPYGLPNPRKFRALVAAATAPLEDLQTPNASAAAADALATNAAGGAGGGGLAAAVRAEALRAVDAAMAPYLQGPAAALSALRYGKSEPAVAEVLFDYARQRRPPSVLPSEQERAEQPRVEGEAATPTPAAQRHEFCISQFLVDCERIVADDLHRSTAALRHAGRYMRFPDAFLNPPPVLDPTAAASSSQAQMQAPAKHKDPPLRNFSTALRREATASDDGTDGSVDDAPPVMGVSFVECASLQALAEEAAAAWRFYARLATPVAPTAFFAYGSADQDVLRSTLALITSGTPASPPGRGSTSATTQSQLPSGRDVRLTDITAHPAFRAVPELAASFPNRTPSLVQAVAEAAAAGDESSRRFIVETAGVSATLAAQLAQPPPTDQECRALLARDLRFAMDLAGVNHNPLWDAVALACLAQRALSSGFV